MIPPRGMRVVHRVVGGIACLVLAAVAYLGAAAWGQLLSWERALAAQQQANTRLQAQNDQAARDRDYYQSDPYVRMRARTALGWRDSHEVLIIPIPATPGP